MKAHTDPCRTFWPLLYSFIFFYILLNFLLQFTHKLSVRFAFKDRVRFCINIDFMFLYWFGSILVSYFYCKLCVRPSSKSKTKQVFFFLWNILVLHRIHDVCSLHKSPWTTKNNHNHTPKASRIYLQMYFTMGIECFSSYPVPFVAK